MPVDAIGSVLSSENSAAVTNSNLSQEDFIRLFLTELNFQDPLEPVDNKEFLAQIAQFSAVEQARQNSEKISNLLLLTSVDQSVSLLGKNVQVNSEAGDVFGSVSAVRFTTDGPLLTVRVGDNFLTNIRLAQISLVQQGN